MSWKCRVCSREYEQDLKTCPVCGNSLSEVYDDNEDKPEDLFEDEAQ